MSPILALILGKLLDYLGQNASTIVEDLKKEFLQTPNPKIQNAIQELGYSPSEENLTKLHDVLKSENKDTDKLAEIIVNNASVVDPAAA